jgi:hypothetical protein
MVTGEIRKELFSNSFKMLTKPVIEEAEYSLQVPLLQFPSNTAFKGYVSMRTWQPPGTLPRADSIKFG